MLFNVGFCKVFISNPFSTFFTITCFFKVFINFRYSLFRDSDNSDYSFFKTFKNCGYSFSVLDTSQPSAVAKMIVFISLKGDMSFLTLSPNAHFSFCLKNIYAFLLFLFKDFRNFGYNSFFCNQFCSIRALISQEFQFYSPPFQLKDKNVTVPSVPRIY